MFSNDTLTGASAAPDLAKHEPEIFGAFAPHVAGLCEAELNVLADRMEAHCDHLDAIRARDAARPKQ